MRHAPAAALALVLALALTSDVAIGQEPDSSCTDSPWQCYIDEHLPAATNAAERTAAIQGALDRVPQQGYRLLAVPELRVPWGTWPLAEGVHVRDARVVHIDLAGSAILVPPGETAITVHRLAQGTSIRRGVIAGVEATQTTGTGIRVEAPGIAIEDVIVRELGIGLDFWGVGGTQYNADSMQVRGGSIYQCDIGIRLKGADAQGGTFLGVVIFGGRVGVQDESFLGNAYVGLQFHTISEHAIRTLNTDAPSSPVANYSTWLGTYLEADCGYDLPGGVTETIDSSMAANVSWFGGGVIPHVRVGDRVGLGVSRLGFRESLPDGGYVSVSIPHGANNSAIAIGRFNADGQYRESHALRWVDQLHRFGLHPVGPNVPNDGLTMPLGYTSSTHPRGLGRAIHDARQAAPLGQLMPLTETP